MRFTTLAFLGMGLFALAGVISDESTESDQEKFSSQIDGIKSANNRPSTASLTLEEDKENLFDNTATPAAASVPQVALAPSFVYVTGSRVNLRASAGTQFQKLGGFNKGTKLVLLEDSDGWSKVSGQIGGRPVTGWMATRYVSLTPPKTAPTATPKPKRAVAVPTSREIARARKDLIRQSIANYSGNCPCPYNRDRAGRKCGRRSAWSRPGGYSPLCYDSDVSRSRLTAYFSREGKIFP